MEQAKSGWCGNFKTEGSCSRRNRESHQGVPTRCWCGNRIATFVSKTKKNPFRRFYRCEVAMQRKGEAHLFKWVDEALVEEVSLVEARQRTVEEDLEALVKTEKSEEAAVLENNGCLSAITWLCCKFW
ncbi:uncharacterized protein At4g04775 isoform X1 [Brassica napus]|uniref:uncharacterized protein At4g04775 isoform X1 n=1 Tax=Brassica napus TaxID=3708 RepID=UPI0020791D99|nr:uncharacterized protein At4g04775 isoform X1 [Brassica napus]